ncbi:MAG TPA: DHHA1 domain-containing protein, partial [Rheinheimera sp.]|nr:DHHA1 domain-containing protein [Rheinheimera sp.]
LFKLVSEGGIASGVRRIEAVSGAGAISYIQQLEQQAHSVATALKGDMFSIAERVQQTLERGKQLEKEIEQLKAKLASQAGASLLEQAQQIAGATVLITQLPATEPKALRTMLDELKNKLNSGVILLATVNDDKISLIAGVTPDLTAKVHAGQLVGWAAEKLGGKGGGRPDMAQAGGSDIAALPAVLTEAKNLVGAKLS